MIGERELAHRASLWHALAPMLDNYVRAINHDLVRTIGVPFAAVDDCGPDRRALINELAFVTYSTGRGRGHVVGDDDLVVLLREVEARLKNLPRPPSDVGDLTAAEGEEVRSLAANLSALESHLGGEVIVHPTVHGCGYVDAVRPDLFVGRVLVEIKAGRRAFRATDLRQSMVYACLCVASGNEREIADLALYNPRTALGFCRSLEEVAGNISGVSLTELARRFEYFVSQPSLSR